MALWRRVQLNPLVASLLLRQLTMHSIHSGKRLVHWDSQEGLMAHQAWPSRTGTMQQGNITSTFMAPQTVISLIIMQVISCCGSYFQSFSSTLHSPPAFFVRVSRASVNFLPSTTNIPFISSVNFLPLEFSFTMPRERGKSKRGPTYYSLVGRHRRTGPPSLFPNPGSNYVRYPYSDQSWCDDAQPEPHLLDPELNYGGCIVEEEIPPNWEENTMEKTTPIGTSFPLNSLEIAMGGCMVEEEIPPLVQDDFKEDATPNVSGPNNEAPGIDWGELLEQGGDPSGAAHRRASSSSFGVPRFSQLLQAHGGPFSVDL
jgi:hypothetical protein